MSEEQGAPVRRRQSWQAATLRQWLCRHDAPTILGRTPPSRFPLPGLEHGESGSPGETSVHVKSRADVCHPAPQSEDSVLCCYVLLNISVAHSWPMLHACPVRDAVRLRALWPGPACVPIYVPCVWETWCNLLAALGARADVRSLCNRRRSGLNQPDVSFQIGTGPRTRPNSAWARR